MGRLFGFGFLFLAVVGVGQGSALPLTNDGAYHLLDRLEILSGRSSDDYLSSQKPFTRGDVTRYALGLDSLRVNLGLSKRDGEDLQYLFDDNNEWVEKYEVQSTKYEGLGEKYKVQSTKYEGLGGKDEVRGTRDEGLGGKVYLDSTHTFYTYSDGGAGQFGIGNDVKSKYTVNKKPLLGVFYKTPANLFEFSSKGFGIKLNPILNFSIAKD